MPYDELPDLPPSAIRDAEELMRYAERASAETFTIQSVALAHQHAQEQWTQQSQMAAEAIRSAVLALQDAAALRTEEMARSIASAAEYFQRNGVQMKQMLEIAWSTAVSAGSFQRDAEHARQNLASASLLFAYADRTALAMNTDLISPRRRTASANLTAAPAITATAEVIKPAASGNVEAQPDTRPESRRPVQYGAMAIKLFWAFVPVMPLVATHLSAEAQVTLALYVALIGLMLIITWRYNDNHKR